VYRKTKKAVLKVLDIYDAGVGESLYRRWCERAGGGERRGGDPIQATRSNEQTSRVVGVGSVVSARSRGEQVGSGRDGNSGTQAAGGIERIERKGRSSEELPQCPTTANGAGAREQKRELKQG
jgi:hypothetical protein